MSLINSALVKILPSRTLAAFLLSLLILLATVNFLGALLPEIGFDALWYHLTLPKMYFSQGVIGHLPGGLLYYSEMPRLAEITYLPLLPFGGALEPHFLNFLAGLATTLVVYLLGRKMQLKPTGALLAAVIFYLTPIVGWLSGSAYIDLIRTFFEVLALYLVLDRRYLPAGLALGLAVSTKTLSLGSLPLLAVIIFWQERSLRKVVAFCLIAIVVAAPWFLSALLNTGYPFYPIGAGILDRYSLANFDLWNLPKMASDFLTLWLAPEDPITPVILLSLPFIIYSLFSDKQLRRQAAKLPFYAFAAFFVWYLIPRTGGGRFFLPYLPAWALLTTLVIVNYKDKMIKATLLAAVILSAVVNLLYRAGALARSTTYLTGRESQTQYLCRRLDFHLGNFADCDGYFRTHLTKTDLVYVAGVHNLFYLDFPFVHETMYRGEKINYLLLQGQNLAQWRISLIRPTLILTKTNWSLVYENKLTRVKLYKAI